MFEVWFYFIAKLRRGELNMKSTKFRTASVKNGNRGKKPKSSAKSK